MTKPEKRTGGRKAQPWLLLATTAMTMATAGLLGGCASGASDASGLSSGRSGGNDNAGAGESPTVPKTGGNSGNATGGASGTEPPPPEVEEKRDFEAPQAGERFVFVANTQRDTVAAIDSTNLTIRTIEVGDAPTRLATVAGKDVALVINVGTRDLSVVRASVTDSQVTTLPVVRGVNRISIAPGGAHAIVWYDAENDNGFTGIGSFQDVTLVRLGATDQAFPLTVGFKPVDVTFNAAGTTAFVVTEDGVSVIALASVTAPKRVPLVPLGPVGQGMARDVSITPDGRYALSREEGQSKVTLVDLTTGVITDLDLMGSVSDLDLAPDASFAMAVVPSKNEVVRIALPMGFVDAASRKTLSFPGETLGSASLTSDSKRVLLYSTGQNIERLLIADLDGIKPTLPVRLRKTVRSVTISPDNQSAVIVHRKAEGDPNAKDIDVETQIDRALGYSVVGLTDGFAKLQLTEAEPGAMAVTPDSSKLFVLLYNQALSLRVAQRVDLASFLVDDFVLGSAPLTVSALPIAIGRVFISQDHPSGRISFINWTTGETGSVTGFELNGRIVQ
ncbi:MAG: hypothetical protein SGI86_01655 [Deltaproteobacteria bacterium]|nr:hypothetical protein [Deltaproteobacteria bacterium]